MNFEQPSITKGSEDRAGEIARLREQENALYIQMRGEAAEGSNSHAEAMAARLTELQNQIRDLEGKKE